MCFVTLLCLISTLSPSRPHPCCSSIRARDLQLSSVSGPLMFEHACAYTRAFFQFVQDPRRPSAGSISCKQVFRYFGLLLVVVCGCLAGCADDLRFLVCPFLHITCMFTAAPFICRIFLYMCHVALLCLPSSRTRFRTLSCCLNV